MGNNRPSKLSLAAAALMAGLGVPDSAEGSQDDRILTLSGTSANIHDGVGNLLNNIQINLGANTSPADALGLPAQDYALISAYDTSTSSSNIFQVSNLSGNVASAPLFANDISRPRGISLDEGANKWAVALENTDEILSSCERFFIRNKTVKSYLRRPSARHHLQTHELFVEKK